MGRLCAGEDLQKLRWCRFVIQSDPRRAPGIVGDDKSKDIVESFDTVFGEVIWNHSYTCPFEV